jgi:post-segregation antitoxin (ccd killing protein)
MTTVKKTISIDKHIAKEASAINSNFSAVVEAALKNYIHHHRAEKAIASFGKWSKRTRSSAEFVSDLRNKEKDLF